MKKIEIRTVYFEKPGRVNTDQVLQIAQERAEELNIKTIVVASRSGFTAARNVLLALGGVLFILIALAIHHSTWFRGGNASFDRLRRALPAAIEWRMIAVLAGVMLIANSVTATFLVPELVVPDPGVILAGRIAQALVGLVLVSQLSFFLFGLLIVLLSIPVVILYFGGVPLIDYGFEYFALAAALGLVGLSGTCPDRIGSRVRR